MFLVSRELAVPFEDSDRLATAFVGARGLAIVFADARGIRFVHRRGRPRYHILGRARLVITSTDTCSLAITSWFVGGLVVAYS